MLIYVYRWKSAGSNISLQLGSPLPRGPGTQGGATSAPPARGPGLQGLAARKCCHQSFSILIYIYKYFYILFSYYIYFLLSILYIYIYIYICTYIGMNEGYINVSIYNDGEVLVATFPCSWGPPCPGFPGHGFSPTPSPPWDQGYRAWLQGHVATNPYLFFRTPVEK